MSFFRRLSGLAYHDILVNAGSLMGTTFVTSALGFAYWWFAAQLFPQAALGFGSALISAMLLLGSFGMLGLGTLLISELPQAGQEQGAMIATALVTAGIVSSGFGVLFAILAPRLSEEFSILHADAVSSFLFAIGVGLTAVTFVLDQALIGLLHGTWQLWRNAIFALAKLLVLLLAGSSLVQHDGLTIYNSWTLGNFISLAGLILTAYLSRRRLPLSSPRWALLRSLRRGAFEHHALNVAIQVAFLSLPVLVTVMLTATLAGGFYIAWLIANLVFAVPYTFTIALFAVASGQREAFTHKIRFTLMLSLAIGVFASALLSLGADWVMGFFGNAYVEQAAWTLRILSFGIFPIIIKDHYVAIGRIRGQVGRTTLLITLGGLLELASAAIGARLHGLHGLSIGWVLALCIEAALMLPPVYQIVTMRTDQPRADALRVSARD